MLCWFGSNGPLKGKYIYHADAESPAKGGRAEIGIHLIDRDAPSPRGLRVYKIGIEPAGKPRDGPSTAGSCPPRGAAHSEDAHRWAATEEPDVACNDTLIDGGWQPQAAEPPASAPPTTKKADAKKVAPKKAAPTDGWQFLLDGILEKRKRAGDAGALAFRSIST